MNHYKIMEICLTLFCIAVIIGLMTGEIKVTPIEPTPELQTIRAAAERNGLVYGSEDWFILLAIRKAENGPRGREFGILHPKCERIMKERPNDTLDIQAGWCADQES